MGKFSTIKLTPPIEFLKEVLTTKKVLLDANKVKRVNVPHFPEVSHHSLTIDQLSVKELYSKVRQLFADSMCSSSHSSLPADTCPQRSAQSSQTGTSSTR